MPDRFELNKTDFKEIKKVFEATAEDHELDDIFNLAVKSAGRLMKADQCFLYLLSDKGDELILRAAETGTTEHLDQVKMRLGEGITGWVAKEKTPAAIPEKAYLDSRFKVFQSLPEDNYEGFLSVPMLYKERLVGVINIQHKEPYQYKEGEISIVLMMAQLIAVAIENARLVNENEEMQDALQTRKLVEKAKGILMQRMDISEEEAYSLMREKSMNMRKPMKEIAAVIIQTKTRDSD